MSKFFKWPSRNFKRERVDMVEVWLDANDGGQLVMYRDDIKSYSWDGHEWNYWSLGGPSDYQNHSWVKYTFVGFFPISQLKVPQILKGQTKNG